MRFRNFIANIMLRTGYDSAPDTILLHHPRKMTNRSSFVNLHPHEFHLQHWNIAAGPNFNPFLNNLLILPSLQSFDQFLGIKISPNRILSI